MNKKCSQIMRILCRLLVLIAAFGIANSVYAQSSTGIVAKMLFPPRNYELPLGDTIIPLVRIWNTDTVADSGMRIQYRISNAVTNITIYSNPIILPSIAPGDSLDTTFEPYISSPDLIDELGTFNGCLYTGDTSCGLIFGIRRTPVPFFDPSDGYSKIQHNSLTTDSIDIPDQTLWVSLGATVVDGENTTWDPPPPRYPGQGTGPDGMISPVIRLDRLDYKGNFYAGTGVGDTLTSFPINIAGHGTMNFSFDYMRAGRHHYSLGWDDSVMFGPESTITDSAGNVIRAGDSLILEFKKPSEPATNPSPDVWNEIAAIDGGRDFEYKTFFGRSNDSGWLLTNDGKNTFLKDTNNYNTADFRFRFRLKANNDALDSSIPIDDADQWYIDNPYLEPPLLPQVEVSWVRLVNPYTKVPLSQASFPIFVSVHNVGVQGGMPFFPLQVDITNPDGDAVYSQYIQSGTWYGSDTVIQFPDWDATHEPGNDTGAYTVFAEIPLNFNANGETQQTYSKFYLNTEPDGSAYQEFAMDGAGMNPAPGVGNDIPKLTGIPGSGMGFYNSNGIGTGSFAMNFYLGHYDSVAGVRLYFGSANPSPDDIRIQLWSGDPNYNSPMNTLLAQRDTAHLDQFSSYYFPQPILLAGGLSYWISVNQFRINNMELGGNFARGGAQIVRENSTESQISPIYTSAYGTQWGSGGADNNGNPIGVFDLGTGDETFNNNWIPFGSAMNSTDYLQPLLHIGDTSPWVGAGTYIPMIRPILGAVPPQSGVMIAPAVQSFSLEQNYPNPFNPSAIPTVISYQLPEQGLVSLTICNVLGDIVKTLVNAPEVAGAHSVLWDGRDENGVFVPAGTYFLSLTSGEYHATEKMTVIE